MCGHFGIINREKNILNSDKLIKIFNQGLYCNSVRGQHGTGVCAINNKGEVKIYKRALNSADFIELPTAKKIINDNNNLMLLGHNRHATYGSHTDTNTHPFKNYNITLFHNGTLKSHTTLNPGTPFDVDSDAISYLLSGGEDIKKSLEKLNGAYALVWYDEELKTLNFARNDERTFYIAETKSGSVIYSSESKLIEWLVDRNDVDIDKIYALAPGIHVSYPLDAKNEVTYTDFKPYKIDYKDYYIKGYKYNSDLKSLIPDVKTGSIIIVKGIEWCNYSNSVERKPDTYGFISCLFKEDIYFNISGVKLSESTIYIDKQLELKVNSITSDCLGYGTFIRVVEDTVISGQIINIKKSVENSLKDIISKSKELDLYVEEEYSFSSDIDVDKETLTLNMVKGANGRYITIKEFLRKVKNGCSNCTEDISVDNAYSTYWDDCDNPYCPDCASFYNII
jgi:predicted glutamine amidotransferase